MAEASDKNIGAVVAGRWRLSSVIGRGATGTVYRGEEEGGAAVAVKILGIEPGRTSAKSEEKERRFEREALAAAFAEHPNCVKVHDFGALEDGRPYLVMDLVEGRALAAVLAEGGAIPSERALAITAHVLRGLGHLHAAGVVHRDLRPADIVLTDKDGDSDFAVILDFGSAALIGAAGAGQQPLTRAGTTLGTPAYMAPEKLRGEPVDGRADLYACVCVLYEMLTGKPPFGGAGDDPQAVLGRHLTGAPPTLKSAGVDGGPALEAVIARGLRKEPAARFASAEELLEAVEKLMAGKLDPNDLDRKSKGLAEPDPHKGTTVFHGAPEVEREARKMAAEQQAAGQAPLSAPAVPAAAEPAPPSVAMPTAGPEMPIDAPVAGNMTVPAKPSAMAEQPAAAPAQPAQHAAEAPLAAAVAANTAAPVAEAAAGPIALRKLLFVVGGIIAIIIIIALVTSGGDGKGEPPSSMGELQKAWNEAGLQAGGFAEVSGASLGGGECESGAVSGLDVTVCSYEDESAAEAAQKAGTRVVGNTTGAAVQEGERLLVVADRKNADPTGKSIDKIIKVFQGRPLERKRPQ